MFKNYRVTPSRISFQSNETNTPAQEKPVNKPYKTSAGLKQEPYMAV